IDDNSGRQEISGDGQIFGIQVQGIPALDRLPADEISGMLNGNFTFVNAGPNQAVEGKLTLSQSRIMLSKAVFNLRSLEFRDINADLILENNTLTIKQTSARGNQLDADLSGTIALSGKNALDLNVSVKPHHLLLAKIEKTLPLDLLRKKNAGDSAISFNIDGTFDEPGFSLN
ncbi:MAG: type II secretion system protein GspN, partial [Desulfobacterales bacterium]